MADRRQQSGCFRQNSSSMFTLSQIEQEAKINSRAKNAVQKAHSGYGLGAFAQR
jgi:hypothetical protein